VVVQSPIKLVRAYASFVKLAHTVFALPFALAGMVAAYALPTRLGPVVIGWEGVFLPDYVPFLWTVVALILLCMVGARSFAMAVNRILDCRIDALNPRTARRELPSGAMSLTQAWTFAVAMAVLYFGACWILGPVVLWLSPIPIALMLVYPLTKRFTWLCHFVLGASLGLAPVGAWVAVRSAYFSLGKSTAPYPYLAEMIGENVASLNTIGWGAVSELAPWLLGAAVMLWVAGFDILYAMQDDQFDREQGLHSMPARFGRARALWISRLSHVGSALLFFLVTEWVIASTRMSTLPEEVEFPSWIRVAPCVMLVGMIYQHSMVKPHDLSRVNLAFFTVNGVISVVFGTLFLLAWLLV
jgi:4-hydroxybenzoate polyprenyltransferase